MHRTSSSLLACLLLFVVPTRRADRPVQDPTGRYAALAAMPKDAIPKDVRHATNKAMQWLVRAQNRDGSWGDNAGSRGDISNTCVAVLALLSTGNTVSRGRHARELRQGVDWVWNRVKRWQDGEARRDDGTLIQAKLGPNIDVYLGTLLLSQVLGMMPSSREEAQAQRVLVVMSEAISSFQKKNGAFETSYEPMLTTVMAWLALRQTHDAGVPVRGASIDKVARYLRRDCLKRGTGVFAEAKWGNRERFVTQAGALRVLYGMDFGRSADVVRGTKVMMRMRFDQDVGGRHGGEEFLGAVFGTQALFLEEDDRFWKWYAKICGALMRCQNADGSWFGHHCITGRVFCTSCSILTMQTPDRLLAMQQK